MTTKSIATFIIAIMAAWLSILDVPVVGGTSGIVDPGGVEIVPRAVQVKICRYGTSVCN